MIVDAHCHIFTKLIIENVATNLALVESLKLDVGYARQRLDPKTLEQSAAANRVDLCLLLPTAAPDRVRDENDRHIKLASKFPRLRSLCTLHPMMQGLSEEIRRILELGIRGFKFSSFSQRFDLLSPEVEAMFSKLAQLASNGESPPVVVLDTFTRADLHFGADPEHLTTPGRLAKVARGHPNINFVGSHMGGLAADFDELMAQLVPLPNLYLDTSNAAHTLKEAEFVELLRSHGSDHILFGTDWPWFHHAAEMPKILSLLEKAGYEESEKAGVFGNNALKLFGL
jgi:predicted TIM-barrel fold metal-dependent hydrolase